MKKKSKLRLLSWITTIAMVLSIFNIPLMGYATEGGEVAADPNTSVVETYTVVGSGFYDEGNENEVGDPVEISQVGDNFYEGTCYVPSSYVSEKGIRITVEEYEEGIEEPLNVEVFSSIEEAGDCTYAPIYWEGEMSGSMTFEYTDYNGAENTYTIYISVFGDDEDGICDNCGLSIEDECTCGTVEYCGECGETIENCICSAGSEGEGEYMPAIIESLDVTYTLAGDGGEYTETINFGEDSSWGEIYLRPYDPEYNIIVTGINANGDEINETVCFEEDEESKEVCIEAVSADGNETRTYYVDIYKPAGPIADVRYYIDGEEGVITKYFRGDNYECAFIPYAYDSEKGINVTVTHLDGTVSEPFIEWEGTNWGMATFDSVVDGDERSYSLEVGIESPSEETGCDIWVEAYDTDDTYYGFSVECEEAAKEEGVAVTIPYGYDARVQLHASTYSQYAQLQDFYAEGEEENGYTLVSDGDVKVFKVVAQNGDERTYTLKFAASKGNSADVEMHVSVRDAALAESDWYGSWREIPVAFTEDQDGNKSAEVVLPYMYDDENGIEVCNDSKDCYSFSYEDNWFYLGDDNEETVEFSVTSPNGEVTKAYEIKFIRESEEESKKAALETFTLGYVDENGEKIALDIDPADASDEDGATITIPESAISSDADEYYVDVYAKLAGYTYVRNAETNADNYNGGNGQDYVDYNVDLSWQRTITIVFDVMASNGQDMVSYKVQLVNGAKAGLANIDEVKIDYTRVNEEDTYRDYIWLDEDTNKGRITLYPFDETKPILISGETADGSEIYELVTFEDGENETVVTFTSKSPNGEKEEVYTVTVIKPEHPLAYVSYQNAAYGENIECDFSEDYQDKVYIPYNYDQEYGINFDITLLDGNKLDSPEIIWESEVREDEHDPLIGKVQFEANGKTYTIDIEVKGVSSNTSVYMEMCTWDGSSYNEWGEEDYKYVYVDSEEAASENGVTVDIPYGCEDNTRFYVYPEFEYANVEGYDEEGNEYSNYVSPGETRIYTVTAQDGTTQDYKITFVESGGNSTEIEANMYFTNTSMNEYEYNCNKYLYFEENDEGIMEMDVILPFNFSEEDGIMLRDYSSENLTYNIPLNEKIIIDVDSDPSFEFTVTSPNGNAVQDYVINFSKETAVEAAKAAISYVELSYKDENGERLYEEIDLGKEDNGNVVVDLPENIVNSDSIRISFYMDGYAVVSKGITMISDQEQIGGQGDFDWFETEIEYFDRKPIMFKFDVTSSDGSNTKTYTFTLKDHDCSFGDGEITSQPTCTEDGVRTYTCEICGIIETDVEEALGHTEEEIPAVEATCTETGLTAGVKCSVCGELLTAQEETEPAGHAYEAVVTEPTCTEYGYTTYTCSACDDRYVEDGDDPLGHDYEAVETKPTCTEKGYIKYTCKRNVSHTYTTELDPDGHEMKEHAAVDATCEEAGNIAYYTCNVCEGYFLDEKGEEAIAADKVVVAATGHKYGAYKTTTKAKFGKDGEQTSTCAACSDKVTKSIAAPKTIKLSYAEYTYNGKIKKPTVKAVYDSEGNKISSKEYKVSYASGRKNVGKYKVTVTFNKNSADYTGSSYTTFKINPKGTSISKLTKVKKGFTVKWKKQTGKMAKTRITGYQYRYSTSSKMTNAVTKTVKGYGKTSAKKTGLKAKKTYYVQVRTYKTVSGVKYYSPWSKYKKVKTK